MICDICKVNEATLAVEQVSNGVSKNIFLCQGCSHKMGFGIFTENIDISITNLNTSDELEKTPSQAKDRICPKCGYKLSNLQTKNKIGCPDCFSFFKTEIQNILKKKGQSLEYTGNLPNANVKEFTDKLTESELRRKLKQAVEAEDYEQAAQLRDELKELELKYDIKN